jgi:hypothetical protein
MLETSPYTGTTTLDMDRKVCIGQNWISKPANLVKLYKNLGRLASTEAKDQEQQWKLFDYSADKRLLDDHSPAIGVWCANMRQSTLFDSEFLVSIHSAKYRISEIENSHDAGNLTTVRRTACEVTFKFSGISPWFVPDEESRVHGCFACGGTFVVHVMNFWANAILTYAIVSRLYRCYEE